MTDDGGSERAFSWTPGLLIGGRLLVAHPQLLDPNFAKTVIYIAEHTADGALGLVLNRPSLLSVRETIPDLPELDPDVVFIGGPVTPDVAIGLGSVDGRPELVNIETELGRTTVKRIFAGYSGWVAGQLEAELDEGAWFVLEAAPDDVLSSHPETLWETVVRRQPGEVGMWAMFPPDPALN